MHACNSSSPSESKKTGTIFAAEKAKETRNKRKEKTHDAREGKHSEAAILELSKLEARAVLALAEAKGVKAKVAGLAARALRAHNLASNLCSMFLISFTPSNQ